MLSNAYKTKKNEESLKLLDEEAKICSSLKAEYEDLKTEGEKLVKKIKKHEKIIFETSP